MWSEDVTMNVATIKSAFAGWSAPLAGKVSWPIRLQSSVSPLEQSAPNARPAPSLLEAVFSLVRSFVRTSVLTVFYIFRTCVMYLLRHPVHAVLNLVFIGIIIAMVMTGSELHQQMILSQISEQTVDKIAAGSRFSRDFSNDDLASDGVRELLRVGGPRWMQRESVRAVLFHARKAGLSVEDQAVLLAIVDIESGFNPMARAATTTACGLFQFVRKTGEMFQLSSAECMDPWLNAKAGVDHYIYNFERRVASKVQELQSAERAFRTFELSYYLHHDGPDSSNPSNDVKATILSGTQFLFKAYHILLDEAASQHEVPSFADRFVANLSRLSHEVLSYLPIDQVPFNGAVEAHATEAIAMTAENT